MSEATREEDPRHSQFLDLCLVYGDFNRPVFLNAILDWFVRSASATELSALRRAIRDRAKLLKGSAKKGRPRAEQSWEWLCSTRQLVWQREILGWGWPQIAKSAGMKPNKPNTRTLQIRRDHYAMLIWQALPNRTDDPEKLARMLEAKAIQRLLRSRVALPFEEHPEECKRIVLALAPRGLEVAANEWNRLVKRRIAARKASPPAVRK